jgi:hypothetical protein
VLGLRAGDAVLVEGAGGRNLGEEVAKEVHEDGHGRRHLIEFGESLRQVETLERGR